MKQNNNYSPGPIAGLATLIEFLIFVRGDKCGNNLININKELYLLIITSKSSFR